MGRSLLLLLLVLLAGCASPMGSAPSMSSMPESRPAPTQVSCQPYGYSPVLITFAYAAGPTTATAAEQTAVAMLRSCAATPDESSVTVTITDLTSSVKAGTGGPTSPNAGEPVWEVQIDTTESVKGGSYSAHYWIEVNQSSGVPTLVAYG